MMELGLTADQTELTQLVRRVLTDRSDTTAIRRAISSPDGYDSSLWRTMTDDIGLGALAIPEQYGGMGLSAVETSLVLEQLGYALTPSPYLGSAVIAAAAVLAANDDDACARLLPRIGGGTIAALCWASPQGRWAPPSVAVTATHLGHDVGLWSLTGEVPLVLDAKTADILLVIAQTPTGPQLFELDSKDEVSVNATPALDPTLRMSSVWFAGAAARLIGTMDARSLAQIQDHALVAIAAMQVGVAARGLDMTVAYTKQRVQFGRAIGSFQALKHRMADMHVQVETARTVARAAAQACLLKPAARTKVSLWAAAKSRAEAASVAKAWCSDALDLVASETVQLHGGIAITWEHDAQLVFKRAHALGQLFGTAAEHRRRISELVSLR